jgi:peptidoglycan/LPS O-acetylase OafA/YrhL
MLQGVLRCYLALVVLVYHYFPTGPMPGRLAVFAFFLISGYLVTRVLDGVYNGRSGLVRFWINRFLRLYPTYAVILLLSALALILPAMPASPTEDMSLPSTATGWLRNIFIVGLTQIDGGLYPHRLIPVAFSLAIEIVYYAILSLLIGFGAGRRLVLPFWLATLAIAVWMVIKGDFPSAYNSFWGPGFMFASGALLHFHWEKMRQILMLRDHSLAMFVGALLAFSIYGFAPAGMALWQYLVMDVPLEAARAGLRAPSIPMLYLSMPIAVIALAASLETPVQVTNGRLNGDVLTKLSGFLGDLSYPLFLSHMLMLVMAEYVLGPAMTTRMIAAIASVLFSVVLVLALERPCQSLRARIRPASGKPAGPDNRSAAVAGPVQPSIQS